MVGPQGEATEVDLEDCKTALVDRKTIPVGPKVVPVRVVLVGRMHSFYSCVKIPKQ